MCSSDLRDLHATAGATFVRLKLLSESDASQLKFEPSALAAIATGISCDSISSSILQPAFLAAVTSGASDADVN